MTLNKPLKLKCQTPKVADPVPMKAQTNLNAKSNVLRLYNYSKE